MEKIILFDIGACYGEHFMPRCGDPLVEVYAFEPEPKRFQDMQNRTAGIPNYKALQFAVSDVSGKATFNICPDAGCSSLHEFAPEVDKVWRVTDKGWGYKRVDTDGEKYRSFYYTEKIEVEVVRLDEFMEKNNLTHVNELHIDTQGSDLAVLKSMGKYISTVDCGEIEVPSRPEMALYKNQHTKEEALDFLRDNGFEVTRIWTNDMVNAEENIAFKRK